jgi:hypothetical protein
MDATIERLAIDPSIVLHIRASPFRKHADGGLDQPAILCAPLCDVDLEVQAEQPSRTPESTSPRLPWLGP